VLALPALALVWPIVGAGALLALLLAAPGDEGTSAFNADVSITEGKSAASTLLSIVEERREGTGDGNNDNDADGAGSGAGAVDVPRLPRATERDGGVRGHDDRDGPERMGSGVRHARVPARMVRRGPGGDKRAGSRSEGDL